MTDARRAVSVAFALATLAALLLPLLASRQAQAFVPDAEKLTNAAGRANFEAKRTGPLRLEVALYTDLPAEGVQAIATGSLLSDPNEGGRVRLDLTGGNGVHEVQLLAGARVQAWRDGQRLERPRIMVPPLALLQVRYGRSLRSALGRLGVHYSTADLARSGDRDCFVLGGQPPGVASERFASRATAWLDSYSYDVVRVDRSDRVRFRFGPSRRFGELRLPAWVAVEEEGRPALYLEFRSAVRAQLGAADFRPPQNP